MDDFDDAMDIIGSQLLSGPDDALTMVCRFLFSTFFVWVLVRFLYYRKSHRNDYYFTFMLISISIFFLIFLLSGVKLKIGFALGLFAIFGIIRYRTETIPVREMTYLFCIITMSVINAMSASLSYGEMLVPNVIILIATALFEFINSRNSTASKLVLYDRIELITPQRRNELVADLKQRTGLDITKVEVGSIDFLRDSAVLKIYYASNGTNENNMLGNQLKINKEEWNQVNES